MSISSEPAPRFPRLLSRPFKKDAIKKTSIPSHGHLADIQKDQESWTPPKVKTKNAFVRVMSKLVPCVSSKGNRKAFDEEDVLDVGGNAPPTTSQGPDVDPYAFRKQFLRHPSIIAQAAPSSPRSVSLSSSSRPSPTSLGTHSPAQSIHNSETFYRAENTSPPNAECHVDAHTTPLSTSSPSASPTPSSPLSIPQSILGEESPAEPGVVAIPNNNKSIFQLMDALTDVLENIQVVTEKDPATRDFFSCYPKVARLYESIFGSDGASFKSRVEEYDEANDDGKFAPYNPEGIYPSASQDTASVYSATPPGSDEFIQDANHAHDSDDVPWIMLSLPTESDLGAREDTQGELVAQVERPVSPWMLSPIWEPTPEPVRKWRVREDIRRRSGAHLRKVASAPDLSYLASGFDSDDEDEIKVTVPVKALSNDREYMDSVSSRVASESKRVGLGIVPDGFLPSPEALASRLKKVPISLGSDEAAVSAGAEVLSGDAAASLGSLSSNFVEVLSPEPVPEAVNASMYAYVPPSPLVSLISAWIPQASSGPSVPLCATQGGEEVPPITAPKTDTLSTLSDRRIRHRSEHYNRMSGVWNEKVLAKSDGSNFPTREESIKRDRRSNAAPIPAHLLPGAGKRGSMGYVKRPTGIRPLILPGRLSLKDSGLHIPSRASLDKLRAAAERNSEAADASTGDMPVVVDTAAEPAVSNGDLESTPVAPAIPSPPAATTPTATRSYSYF